MDAEIQTQETESTEPKRSRRKSARRALEEICDRLESCINAPNQKPAKMIDALQKVADIRLKLLDYDTEKASDAAIAENETLKAQHEKDTAEIERLNGLKETVTPRIVGDDGTMLSTIAEHKRTIDTLKSFIKFLASEFTGDPAKMSVAVILKFGKTARAYVTALGIDFDAYFSNLNSPQIMTEGNLRMSVDPPENEDLHTMLNRPAVGVEFAVAALAVVHRVDMKAPVRRVNGNNSSRDYASLAADEFND